MRGYALPYCQKVGYVIKTAEVQTKDVKLELSLRLNLIFIFILI